MGSGSASGSGSGGAETGMLFPTMAEVDEDFIAPIDSIYAEDPLTVTFPLGSSDGIIYDSHDICNR